MAGNPKFVDPMLLLRAERLPEGAAWLYELKLDGFRAQAIKSSGRVSLRSRNDKDFNKAYPAVVRALAALPEGTVVDGEIVALDEAGRPSFSALQNSDAATPVVYYVFDVMVLDGRDVMRESLTRRRQILEEQVLPLLDEPIRESAELHAELRDLIESVRAHGLEGLVAKRRDSVYEPGERSGAWQKMRVNRVQPFVIGGYTIGAPHFDGLVFGYFEEGTLVYAGRTRSGFTPALRASLAKRFSPLAAERCPFVNLPEARAGRWGEGLTEEKMKSCRWLRPLLVADVEFVEWTPEARLRHSRFVRLREDLAADGVTQRGHSGPIHASRTGLECT